MKGNLVVPIFKDDKKVKTSNTDAVAGYLLQKLKAGANITIEEITDEGIKKIQISGTGGGGGIADAPADGSKYARKDNTWVVVLDGVDGDDGAKPIQITGLTLAAASWVTDGSLKKYTLSHASITGTSYVEVIPANSSIAIVKAAEILPETDSAAGTVSIWATNTPTGDISVTINIYETA